MSYISTGAVGSPSANRQAIIAARSAIGDFLSLLKAQPKTLKNSPTVMKILPSSDETFTGPGADPAGRLALSRAIVPMVWPGANVIAWPAEQLAQFEAAWGVLTAYLAAGGSKNTSKLQFARNLTGIQVAINQTSELLMIVDEFMARDGIPRGSSIKLYLGLAALLGLAVFAGKKGVFK